MADTPTVRKAPKIAISRPARPTAPRQTTIKQDDERVGDDPFKIDVESLLKLANDGDFTAAQIAFHETAQCYDASNKLASTKAELNRCAETIRPEFLDKCREQANELNESFRAAKEQSKPCSRLSPYDEISLRYHAARIAAKFGDVDAQMCLLEGDYDQRVMHLSDEEQAQYQIDVINYLNQAMERGDWRAPEAMTVSAKSRAYERSLQYLLTEGDGHTRYRNRHLMRFGALGEYAEELGPDSDFPGDYYADDDSWAKQQYEAHFLKSPRLHKNPTVCGPPF